MKSCSIADTRSSKCNMSTKRMEFDANVDRISILPKNIIDVILTLMPLRDAVRTSLLSRNWRYEWTTLSQILIDRESFPVPEKFVQVEFDRKIVKTVYEIFLLHDGPIINFTLSVDINKCTDIDRWIYFVSRKGIKKLTLDIWEGDGYKLPSCFFTIYNLTSLVLCGCLFIPPSSFKGFSMLSALDLQRVVIADSELEILVSSCTLLVELTIINLTGCSRLEISAPKLLKLTVECEFEDLFLKKTPLLDNASINLSSVYEYTPGSNIKACKIVDVLAQMPNIQTLTLLGYSTKILAVGNEHAQYSVNCPLKSLSVQLNFEDFQEMVAVFDIFRSSAVMQSLDIEVCSDMDLSDDNSIEGFWDSVKVYNFTFSHLEILKLSHLTGSASGLKFIEFVLANAPVLEKLHVTNFEKDVENERVIIKELIRFPRFSPKAELIIPA